MRLIIVLLFVSTGAFGQMFDSLNMKTQPRGGKGALQIVYYRIDFTKEETDFLRTHAPELIFSVSPQGKARLEKVNDLGMQSIVDSMMRVNDRLPDFYPERVNGRAENGVYFLKLTWPNYQSQLGLISPYQPLTFYNPVMRKLSEFSDITYRGPRYDMILGVFNPGFNGNLGKVIKQGWGAKFDFMIYGSKGWGGGFGTSIILGKPSDFRDRNHMITLFNGMIGKVFRETKMGQFGLQIEPAFGITDIVDRDNDVRFIGLGFCPGVSAIYMLSLGPGRMSRQYFLPTSYKHYLSFHVGIRSMLFNTVAASGTIADVGISYRLATRPVANYKLKE